MNVDVRRSAPEITPWPLWTARICPGHLVPLQPFPPSESKKLGCLNARLVWGYTHKAPSCPVLL